MSLLVFIIKAGQAYPPRFYQWIDYLKSESVSRSRKKCQNQIGIPAHEMSSEYFTRTRTGLAWPRQWKPQAAQTLRSFETNVNVIRELLGINDIRPNLSLSQRLKNKWLTLSLCFFCSVLEPFQSRSRPVFSVLDFKVDYPVFLCMVRTRNISFAPLNLSIVDKLFSSWILQHSVQVQKRKIRRRLFTSSNVVMEGFTLWSSSSRQRNLPKSMMHVPHVQSCCFVYQTNVFWLSGFALG